ncbi:MAG: prepilin-type N-terminal cleavage/methylation domain-containing protein [Microbacteriaceae bacterium]|nr:prepilin-type N-terminal cleavage/methylation domain-containing protein [Burkholderiaceae bacterium]
MNHRLALTPPRGFTLIESLIALLVVGAGMLLLSVTQMKLVQNADLARQRGEATRLAAEKIESSRAYTTITGTGVTAWNGLAGGSDTSTSNITYTRRWTVDGDINQPMRQLNVAVSWTDRTGTAQSVSLSSVISRTDPADVGSLAFPLPANTTLKRPKNRNLNIPVPALDLGNGQSVVQLANNFAVVFSNESGYVVKTCNFVVTAAADLAGCTAASAYIVAGYISLSGVSTFPASLDVNTSLVSGSTAITCSVSNAVDQTSQATISGYKYYLCVVSVASAGAPWSGRFQLSGMATGTNYQVCRFQYPVAAGVSTNQRNVQPYSNVVESLDQQNYIITTGSSCPTVQNLVTTAHQDCRSSNASRATDCPAS